MNVSTIILGIISVVLAIAFFFSYGGMKNNDNAADQAELKEIREQIAALNAESDALRRTPDAYPYPTTPMPMPTVAPPAMPDETATTDVSEENLAKIKRLEDEVASMKDGKEKDDLKSDIAAGEADLPLRDVARTDDRLNRNKKSVINALTLGKVIAYDSELGFLTFRPAMDRAFTPGEKLAVRRNSGILSRATVSGEGNGEVAADVMPNALAGGMPQILAGDDIILLPDYYDAPEELGSDTSGATSNEFDDLGPVGNATNSGGNNAAPGGSTPAPDGIPPLPDLPPSFGNTGSPVQEIPLDQ